jgi:hypothetical protein
VVGIEAPDVRASQVTLKGTVNPEGLATSYYFEYGTTTAYGHSAPAEARDVGEGLADVEAAQRISGLQEGTEYHFRLVAGNEAGTVYGADMTFTPGAQHWYACTKQTGGHYKTSKCAEEGSPNEWESVRFKEGEEVGVSAHGGTLAVSTKSGGVKLTLNCETEVSATTLANPKSGGSGSGAGQLGFKGCKVEGKAMTGCKATPGAALPMRYALIVLGGKTEVAISPKEGTTLGSFSVSGCEESWANKTWSLTGTAYGLYSNAASQIEFNTETTASGMLLSGTTATATGTIGLEASGGGYVRAE